MDDTDNITVLATTLVAALAAGADSVTSYRHERAGSTNYSMHISCNAVAIHALATTLGMHVPRMSTCGAWLLADRIRGPVSIHITARAGAARTAA